MSLYQSLPTPSTPLYSLTQLARALKTGFQHVSLKVRSSSYSRFSLQINPAYVNTVYIQFCKTCSLTKPERQKRQSAGMSIMWRFQAATSNPPQSALPIDSELLLMALYVNVVGVTVHSHREAEAAPAATD